MKITISLLVGFALGFLAAFFGFGRTTMKHHWHTVGSYRAYVTDPANYKSDAATGLLVCNPPGDPLPDLDALVAAGELEHVDLVFPTIPNNGEVGRRWMTFCHAHKEIVYITGNPSYAAFKPDGPQPLHLNIWFKNADASIIQKLIRELEGKNAK